MNLTSSNAPVTLLEFGDFECPYCRRAYPIIKELQRIEGDRLKFVFRNFPLSQIHQHALHAAYAVQAADKQGKFWEMHDMLFENQYALEDQNLINYAQSLNLDIQQFIQDMKSEEIIKKIKEDFLSGARSGVNGTPTFFINGIRFDKPYELSYLQEAVESVV